MVVECRLLKQVRRKLQRYLVRMMHRCLVQTFEAWVSHVDEQHALEYARSKANRIANVRKQDTLYTCLMSWIDRAHAWKTKRHMMRKAITHISRLYMRSSFDHWSGLVQECVEVRLKLQGCIVRMSMKHMCEAFDAWLAYTSDQKAKMHLMNVVIHRMQRVHVTQAFETWYSNVCYLKQVRRKLKRCVMQMSHRCLVQTFEAWVSHVDEQHALEYARPKPTGLLMHASRTRCTRV